MPKRTDVRSILVLGSGPIVIGQACEFDYSGTQAVKALKREGYRVVLVNSNPATIMTDPDVADATYIEPLVPEAVEEIGANLLAIQTAEDRRLFKSAMEEIGASVPRSGHARSIEDAIRLVQDRVGF